MDKLFNNILASHEREDNAMLLSEEALLHVVRCEFSNAETLICQAQKKGFSVSDFFSGKELPADMELPVRPHFLCKNCHAERAQGKEGKSRPAL